MSRKINVLCLCSGQFRGTKRLDSVCLITKNYNNGQFIVPVLLDKMENEGVIQAIYIRKRTNEVNTNSQRQHTSNQKEHKFTETTHIQPKRTQIHRDNTYPTKMNTNSEAAHIQPKGTQIDRDNTQPSKMNTNLQRQNTSFF